MVPSKYIEERPFLTGERDAVAPCRLAGFSAAVRLSSAWILSGTRSVVKALMKTIDEDTTIILMKTILMMMIWRTLGRYR